jgi:hypothetical protein
MLMGDNLKLTCVKLCSAVLAGILITVVSTAHPMMGNDVGVNVPVPVKIEQKIGEKIGKHIKEKIEGGQNIAHRYQEALKHFNESKKNLGIAEKENSGLFEAKKRYLLSWTDLCEKWMLKLMVKVNNSGIDRELKVSIMEKLGAAINEIRRAKEGVNRSATPEELRNAALQLRDSWNEARVQIRLAVFDYAEYKLERILEKIIQLRDRFEAAGMNVSHLDEKISELETSTREFKTYVDNENLQKAVAQLTVIRQILQEIFIELRELAKEYVGRVAYGYESGLVYAKINGSFDLKGNFTALIRGGGEVAVTPTSAVVSSDGASNNGKVRLLVRGKDVTVVGTGDFRIFAYGKGILQLNGNGYYRVKNIGEPMSPETPFEGSVTVEFGR